MAEEEKLVLLTTVSNDVERSLIMGLFQSEHILALARDASTNCGLKPYLGQQARVLPGLDTNIYVYERDYEQAKGLWDTYHERELSEEEQEQQNVLAECEDM